MPHITFIHGIANKPPKEKLEKIWLDALADETLGNDDGITPGTDGIKTSMIYWADVLYDKPLAAAQHESLESLESTEVTVLKEPEPDMVWKQATDAAEKTTMDKLEKKLLAGAAAGTTPAEAATIFEKNFEAIPLPWPVKERLMKVLLKDVYYYLFNKTFSPRPGTTYMVQDEIRKRVVDALGSVQTDKHIVVAHSMGTVIMYDCLKRVSDCPGIDALVTIGSPLGIDEVQHCLKPEWTREDGFPAKLNADWVNVFDFLDPVTGFDGNIANDYKKNNNEVIEIIKEANEGAWRHDISKYLKRPLLRKALAGLLNL